MDKSEDIRLNENLSDNRNDLTKLNNELKSKADNYSARLSYINTVILSIWKVNQLIVKEKNPVHLIRETCTILTGQRGYTTAWIGLIDESGNWNNLVESGFGREFSSFENQLLKGRLSACCKKVLKVPGVIRFESPVPDCGDCPLLGSGTCNAPVLVRIEHGNSVYGVLSVTIPEDIVFDEEEILFIEEVAGDIGFALHHIKLSADIVKTNTELQKRTNDLDMRVKELNCLYSINEIFAVPGITESEVFNELITIIQAAWRYFGLTTVRIQIKDQVYQSENFRETPWILKDELVLNGTPAGLLEISYLEKKEELFSSPFPEEEIILFKNIVRTIERFLLRKMEEEQLKAAKENAEKADRLKTSFLMNMSHEIRTPMNAILGFSDLLSDPGITDDQRTGFIKIIQENGDTLLHLIDDILDISKIETNQLEIVKKEVPLKSLIYDLQVLYENHRIKLGKEDIEIRIAGSLPATEINLLTDPNRLRQILTNLLDNAFKFTEKGFVEIGYSIEPDNKIPQLIKFYIKDTGIGIDKDYHAQIFDRFMKVESKMKLYGGNGLGLTISRNLARLLGGDISVESDIGKGSVFYLTLPYERAHKTIDKSFKGQHDTLAVDLSEKVILVAENDESNYSLIENYLENSRAKLVWAKNGKEAVNICKSNKEIDMILMDIKMPEMDGYTATREIRKISNDIPVIAVTAFAADNESEESKKAGCTDYLSKPVKSDDLMKLINKYIHNGYKNESYPE